MNDVTEKFDAKTSPLDEVLSVEGEDEGVVGFIIGLAVLGAALAILLVAAFWGWWKWIRPYEYKTMENESVTSDDNGLNPDFDKKAVLEGHIPEPLSTVQDQSNRPQQDLENSFFSGLSETYNDPARHSPPMNPNPDISSVETGEPYDDASPGSPPKERRKSLRFNEDVERIEIVTEVPADNLSDSEKEVYKF